MPRLYDRPIRLPPGVSPSTARAGITLLDGAATISCVALCWYASRLMLRYHIGLNSLPGSVVAVVLLSATSAFTYARHRQAVDPTRWADLMAIAVPVVIMTPLALLVDMLAFGSLNALPLIALLMSPLVPVMSVTRGRLKLCSAGTANGDSDGFPTSLRGRAHLALASFDALAAQFVAGAGLRACGILTLSADAGALVLRGSACTPVRACCEARRHFRIPLRQAPVIAELIEMSGWLWLNHDLQSSLNLETRAALLCDCVPQDADVALTPLVVDGNVHGIIVAVHHPGEPLTRRLQKLNWLDSELISQREAVRKALGDSTYGQLCQPLGQLLKDLPFPLILLNSFARVIMVNAAAAATLGTSSANLLGTRLCPHGEDCVCPIHTAGRTDTRVDTDLRTLIASVPGSSDVISAYLWKVGDLRTPQRLIAITIPTCMEGIETPPAAELAAMIAHDLRSPLTALHMTSQLALEKDLAETDRTRLLTNISHQVARLDRVTVDLIEAYATGSGPDELGREPINLRQLALEVVEEFNQGGVVDRAIPVSIARGLSVPADCAKIRSVLRNLVSNAVKYGGDRIAISAEITGDDVVVSVIDDGPGIAEADAPFVFDRFYRAGPRASRPGGHGIGLFAARRLVEQHGGRIWLESRPSEGCRFNFALPATPYPAVIAV